MSRKAKTRSDSKSLKEGMSPVVGELKDISRVFSLVASGKGLGGLRDL